MSDLVPTNDPVGPRLKEARDTLGWTTREVSKRLLDMGVKASHASIGNYERGATVPDEKLLGRLAVLYGREVEWFRTRGTTLSFVQFRKASSLVRAGDERMFLATAAKWIDAYKRLEDAVHRPLPRNGPGFEIPPTMSGEEVAVKVRSRRGLGATEAVPSVVAVMEDLFGIRVLELPTETRIDGFAAKSGDEHVVILNPAVPEDRNRLSAGHEAGHVAFTDCVETSHLKPKEIEGRAYEFAFHLLMPSDVLAEAFRGKSMVKLVQHKERYGVSLAAMVYRAERKGILGRTETQWLWRQFALRGWRKKEPGKVNADRATRFEQLFEEAVIENPGSRIGLLKVMGVTDAEMQHRLRMASGSVQGFEDGGETEEEGGDEGEGDVLPFPQ